MPRNSPFSLVAGASVLVAAALGYWLLRDDGPAAARGKGLTLHCAAGIQRPVTAILQQYEAEFGVAVRTTYGGSGTLLSGLRVHSH